MQAAIQIQPETDHFNKIETVSDKQFSEQCDAKGADEIERIPNIG
jgi:hypothetical protein